MNKYYIFGFILSGILLFASSVNAATVVGPYGTVYVGDSWQVYITGLDAGEIITTTGGKNGETHSNNYGPAVEYKGVHSIDIRGTFSADEIGSWQLSYTRANGDTIGAISFTVAQKISTSKPGSSCGTAGSYPNAPAYTGPASGEPDVVLPLFNAYIDETNVWFKQNVGELVNRLNACGLTVNGPVFGTAAGSIMYHAYVTASITVNGHVIPLYPSFFQLGSDTGNAYVDDNSINAILSKFTSEERISLGFQVRSIKSSTSNTTTTGSSSSGSASVDTTSKTYSEAGLSSYASNLTNVINKLTQKYKAMLSSISTQTAQNPSVTNTDSYIGASSGFPKNVKVIAHLLNVRSAPNTQAVVLKQLPAGSIFVATESVNGEDIEGTDDWWLIADTYIWAGGTMAQ